MKPNVLHLIDSLNQGGSERQAVQLAGLLQKSGRYQVHVACLSASGPLIEDLRKIGIDPVPEYPLVSFYKPDTIVKLLRFAALLRTRKIDIVHAHDFYTNIFGMTGAILAGVPVRVASRRQSAVRTSVQRMLERCAYRLAHTVVVNCDEIGRQLIEEGVPARKILTVYNGVDLKPFTPAPGLNRKDRLEALDLPVEEALRLVTIVANLREVKDHRTFLKMASQVRSAEPDVVFVIAGEGETLGEMEQLAARFGLKPVTFFIGRCRCVAELLALSDVCVLSSRSEGFSNSILEYMASGRPVVATDVGGAREAVADGKSGYLVPAGDAQIMASRVISLLNSPEEARIMGERGRLIASDRFSCQAQLDSVERMYASLLTKTESKTAPGITDVRREGAR